MVAVDPITQVRLYDPNVDLYPVAYVLLITTAIGEDATCRVTPAKSVRVCYTRGSIERAICDVQVVTIDTYKRNQNGIYTDYELAEGCTASGPGSRLIFLVKRCTSENRDQALSDLCIVHYSNHEPIPYNYTAITSWKDTRLLKRGEKILCAKFMWQTIPSEVNESTSEEEALPSFSGTSVAIEPPKYSSRSKKNYDGYHSSYFVARALEAIHDSNWSLSMMYFSASLEYDPTNAFLLLQRAIISNAFRRKLSPQQNDLATAFNLEPDWVTLCYYRGLIHERIANSGKCMNFVDMHTSATCYKKCLTLDPDFEYPETGVARDRLQSLRPTLMDMYMKRSRRAIASFLHQTSINELIFALEHCETTFERAEVLKLRGMSYLSLEQYEKALSDFTEVYEVTSQLDILINKSYVLRKLGRTQEADEQMKIVRMGGERVSKSSQPVAWYANLFSWNHSHGGGNRIRSQSEQANMLLSQVAVLH